MSPTSMSHPSTVAYHCQHALARIGVVSKICMQKMSVSVELMVGMGKWFSLHPFCHDSQTRSRAHWAGLFLGTWSWPVTSMWCWYLESAPLPSLPHTFLWLGAWWSTGEISSSFYRSAHRTIFLNSRGRKSRKYAREQPVLTLMLH